MGRAWRGRVAAGSPVALERAGASRRFAGHTETDVVLKIQNDITSISSLINKDTAVYFHVDDYSTNRSKFKSGLELCRQETDKFWILYTYIR